MPRGIQTNPEIKLLIVKRAKEDRIDELAKEFSTFSLMRLTVSNCTEIL